VNFPVQISYNSYFLTRVVSKSVIFILFISIDMADTLDEELKTKILEMLGKDADTSTSEEDGGLLATEEKDRPDVPSRVKAFYDYAEKLDSKEKKTLKDITAWKALLDAIKIVVAQKKLIKKDMIETVTTAARDLWDVLGGGPLEGDDEGAASAPDASAAAPVAAAPVAAAPVAAAAAPKPVAVAPPAVPVAPVDEKPEVTAILKELVEKDGAAKEEEERLGRIDPTGRRARRALLKKELTEYHYVKEPNKPTGEIIKLANAELKLVEAELTSVDSNLTLTPDDEVLKTKKKTLEAKKKTLKDITTYGYYINKRAASTATAGPSKEEMEKAALLKDLAEKMTAAEKAAAAADKDRVKKSLAIKAADAKSAKIQEALKQGQTGALTQGLIFDLVTQGKKDLSAANPQPADAAAKLALFDKILATGFAPILAQGVAAAPVVPTLAQQIEVLDKILALPVQSNADKERHDSAEAEKKRIMDEFVEQNPWAIALSKKDSKAEAAPVLKDVNAKLDLLDTSEDDAAFYEVPFTEEEMKEIFKGEENAERWSNLINKGATGATAAVGTAAAVGLASAGVSASVAAAGATAGVGTTLVAGLAGAVGTVAAPVVIVAALSILAYGVYRGGHAAAESAGFLLSSAEQSKHRDFITSNTLMQGYQEKLDLVLYNTYADVAYCEALAKIIRANPNRNFWKKWSAHKKSLTVIHDANVDIAKYLNSINREAKRNNKAVWRIDDVSQKRDAKIVLQQIEADSKKTADESSRNKNEYDQLISRLKFLEMELKIDSKLIKNAIQHEPPNIKNLREQQKTAIQDFSQKFGTFIEAAAVPLDYRIVDAEKTSITAEGATAAVATALEAATAAARTLDEAGGERLRVAWAEAEEVNKAAKRWAATWESGSQPTEDMKAMYLGHNTWKKASIFQQLTAIITYNSTRLDSLKDYVNGEQGEGALQHEAEVEDRKGEIAELTNTVAKYKNMLKFYIQLSLTNSVNVNDKSLWQEFNKFKKLKNNSWQGLGETATWMEPEHQMIIYAWNEYIAQVVESGGVKDRVEAHTRINRSAMPSSSVNETLNLVQEMLEIREPIAENKEADDKNLLTDLAAMSKDAPTGAPAAAPEDEEAAAAQAFAPGATITWEIVKDSWNQYDSTTKSFNKVFAVFEKTSLDYKTIYRLRTERDNVKNKIIMIENQRPSGERLRAMLANGLAEAAAADKAAADKAAADKALADKGKAAEAEGTAESKAAANLESRSRNIRATFTSFSKFEFDLVLEKLKQQWARASILSGRIKQFKGMLRAHKVLDDMLNKVNYISSNYDSTKQNDWSAEANSGTDQIGKGTTYSKDLKAYRSGKAEYLRTTLQDAMKLDDPTERTTQIKIIYDNYEKSYSANIKEKAEYISKIQQAMRECVEYASHIDCDVGETKSCRVQDKDKRVVYQKTMDTLNARVTSLLVNSAEFAEVPVAAPAAAAPAAATPAAAAAAPAAAAAGDAKAAVVANFNQTAEALLKDINILKIRFISLKGAFAFEKISSAMTALKTAIETAEASEVEAAKTAMEIVTKAETNEKKRKTDRDAAVTDAKKRATQDVAAIAGQPNPVRGALPPSEGQAGGATVAEVGGAKKYSDVLIEIRNVYNSKQKDIDEKFKGWSDSCTRILTDKTDDDINKDESLKSTLLTIEKTLNTPNFMRQYTYDGVMEEAKTNVLFGSYKSRLPPLITNSIAKMVYAATDTLKWLISGGSYVIGKLTILYRAIESAAAPALAYAQQFSEEAYAKLRDLGIAWKNRLTKQISSAVKKAKDAAAKNYDNIKATIAAGYKNAQEYAESVGKALEQAYNKLTKAMSDASAQCSSWLASAKDASAALLMNNKTYALAVTAVGLGFANDEYMSWTLGEAVKTTQEIKTAVTNVEVESAGATQRGKTLDAVTLAESAASELDKLLKMVSEGSAGATQRGKDKVEAAAKLKNAMNILGDSVTALEKYTKGVALKQTDGNKITIRTAATWAREVAIDIGYCTVGAASLALKAGKKYAYTTAIDTYKTASTKMKEVKAWAVATANAAYKYAQYWVEVASRFLPITRISAAITASQKYLQAAATLVWKTTADNAQIVAEICSNKLSAMKKWRDEQVKAIGDVHKLLREEGEEVLGVSITKDAAKALKAEQQKDEKLQAEQATATKEIEKIDNTLKADEAAIKAEAINDAVETAGASDVAKLAEAQVSLADEPKNDDEGEIATPPSTTDITTVIEDLKKDGTIEDTSTQDLPNVTGSSAEGTAVAPVKAAANAAAAANGSTGASTGGRRTRKRNNFLKMSNTRRRNKQRGRTAARKTYLNRGKSRRV
jgi:hypothetical protein